MFNKIKAIYNLIRARDYIVITQRTEREEIDGWCGNDILHWFRSSEDLKFTYIVENLVKLLKIENAEVKLKRRLKF